MSRMLKIAVEGCCHGELNKIYSEIERAPGHLKPDLLIVCGDFQSLRNETDLNSLAVPDKYKRLGDFAEYYDGTRMAPVLTLFVGGNHEASNYLSEIPYGGWVAKNIYYMGLQSVIWFKGLRIAGLSGIYNHHHFYHERRETVPFDRSTMRSVYHTRFAEVLQLALIRKRNIGCMISHDWPEGIVHHGDLQRLLKFKPFFKGDIEKGELGSPGSRELLKLMKPRYWFSAHLHVKFEATVKYGGKRKLSISGGKQEPKKVKNDEEIDLGFGDGESGTTKNNDDEIDLGLDDEVVETNTKPAPPSIQEFTETNFLALDKVIRGRKFIEYLEVPITDETHPSAAVDSDLYYDEEHIKILKWFQNFQKTQAFKRLGLKNLNDQLIDQLGRDIDLIKIADSPQTFKVPSNFEADLSNPGKQTSTFMTTFGL